MLGSGDTKSRCVGPHADTPGTAAVAQFQTLTGFCHHQLMNSTLVLEYEFSRDEDQLRWEERLKAIARHKPKDAPEKPE